MEENNNTSEDTNVRVAVRCRPFNNKEKLSQEQSCVSIVNGDTIILTNPYDSNEQHNFAFDLGIH